MKTAEVMSQIKVGRTYEFMVRMTKNFYWVTGKVLEIKQLHLPLITIKVAEYNNPHYPEYAEFYTGKTMELWGNKINKVKEDKYQTSLVDEPTGGKK